MTSRDFCYWLQGFFELGDKSDVKTDQYRLTHQQIDSIRNHLAMVFRHEIDPSFGNSLPDLTKIHHPEGPKSPLTFDPFYPPPKLNC